ncbi:hypothetical protein [Erwinia phage phiEaP8]|uniref:Uncharacterized protein n=1 Tax=Erwinia phage phiEaP8 TaxID=2178928 RepID=A0A3G1QTR9_9CAUD|nr:hypothetical protein HYP64_gp37 [Erwinia phage phiEaP8]AWN06255.1 hypothetical protein [Erwinia phage phiEaP8]
MTKRVFVFGSNEAGVHGAGAAKFAYEKRGARYGFSYGHMGDSFAIPTKDAQLKTLSIAHINDYVKGFLAFAKGHKRLTFQVTCVGCGLAGLKHADIAPMFNGAPDNCLFDEEWKPFLGDTVEYWGTF